MYFDTKTPAFGIRIGKTRKTWLVLKEPNRTKVRIGHYPDLPLSIARRKALVVLGNPLLRSEAPSFDEARDEFLSQGTWREASRYEINRTLRRHFHWSKTLDKINHQDIQQIIDGITAKSEAAHALKDIKSFFSWCVPRYIPHSPCEGLKTPLRYSPRQRILSYNELQATWKAAGALGAYGTRFRLLLTTGQRWGQINALRRSDISDGLIHFSPEIMKSAREHVIPYFHLTASLIDSIPNTGDMLFPARGIDKPATYQGKLKLELDKLSGVTNWTLHDCRRVFASGMASLGVSLPTVERCLAHQSHSFAGIVQVYQLHSWLPEMRIAYEKWENHLSNLVR